MYQQKPYGVVLTYGTFDLFHAGHVRLLERIAALGSYVIVGCSTDEFNSGKGKVTAIPYEDRVEVLNACKFVDLVIPETAWDQKPGDIKTHGAELFVMGDDWAGEFDDLKAHCEVLYLPRTPDISSTQIKHTVKCASASS